MRYFNMEQKNGVSEVYIYGDITSWPWAESDVSSFTLARALKDVEGDVVVYINSHGGEVAEALAIYSTLRQKAENGAKVTTVNDGFACSAASMIFMAGSERVVYPYSMVMVHNAWVYTAGNADELRQAADDLEKINAASNAVYLDNITIGSEALKELLDAEKWLNAEEALEMGFATLKRHSSGKAAARLRFPAVYQPTATRPALPKAEETQPESPQKTALQQFLNI